MASAINIYMHLQLLISLFRNSDIASLFGIVDRPISNSN